MAQALDYLGHFEDLPELDLGPPKRTEGSLSVRLPAYSLGLAA